MEREFLLGLDFDLYVNKSTYESWLKFLTGLVMNKEKDSKRWQRTRCPVRTSHLHRPGCHRHAQLTPSRASSHRARSTSPRRASICAVSHPLPCPPLAARYTPQPPSPPRPLRSSRSKRTAADAFSPTSASFSAAQLPPAQVPRRMHGLSLDIPQPTAHSRESSASPLESLQSFSKLSLGASPIDQRTSPAWPIKHDEYPRTLASSYHIDDQRLPVAPQVSIPLPSPATVSLTYHFSVASVLLLVGWFPSRVRGGSSDAEGTPSRSSGPCSYHHRLSVSALDADGCTVGVG